MNATTPAHVTTGIALDDNLVTETDGTVGCRHCGTRLGESTRNPLAEARVHERTSLEAGPGVHVDPGTLTDRPIVIRQAFCPGCLTLLSTEIVPGDEPSYRRWSLR